MATARRVAGFLVILGAAALLYTGGGLSRGALSFHTDINAGVPATQATTSEDAISTVLSDADTNNSSSYGAPQQAVAAEWAVRDLTAIVARQQDDMLRQTNTMVLQTNNMITLQRRSADRQRALLALLCIAAGLALMTTGRAKPPYRGYPVTGRAPGGPGMPMTATGAPVYAPAQRPHAP